MANTTTVPADCNKCYYAFPTADDGTPILQCRRYPPTVHVMMVPNPITRDMNTQAHSIFPICAGKCGEWKERKDGKPVYPEVKPERETSLHLS